ncbi:MucR family transcriptional regulator [Methylobacterium isbiliense]|uniref:Transcriptional regulatory protein ros n=1 Tax=Methylobacterium isbiliense TaxID=315478 RepID=A0ABQ4SDU4_9HYPH|nr:MucR family transcriptional regulator [Methylobacterium isbiliense]MDN3622581.1 MucR family transcriptional regulator [Methylobacterium isbiliense]GJE00571.1 Transcriptional regulatory protein ros [Methylobacterium isbiliense]
MPDDKLTLALDASRPLLVMTTATLVAAYVQRNAVPAADLPGLIASVHGALAGLGQPAEPVAPSEHKTPAEIRRSVTPEALISFLDGKPYKTLKRHLGTHGMTPEAYRARFGLGYNYPMTAANYAAQRSELAKAAGLGRKAGPRLVGSEAA